MKKLVVILALGLIASIGLTGISLAAGDNPYTCDPPPGYIPRQDLPSPRPAARSIFDFSSTRVAPQPPAAGSAS